MNGDVTRRQEQVRFFLTMGGRRCVPPTLAIVVLAIFSAVAFGAAPYFLSRWVTLLSEIHLDMLWLRYFCFYLAAYVLALLSRDVQWWLYARLESFVFAALTRRLTVASVRLRTEANGVGLMTQTLEGARSLLFCSFFIMIPALLETLSMLMAILGTTPLWMAIPLVLHTGGFLYWIDFGTQRVAAHQRVLTPLVARVLDLVGAIVGEKALLRRYADVHIIDGILDRPIQLREIERQRMGWTRTWTMTLLNGWSLLGLSTNLALALWFYSHDRMTLGEVVAVESIFFLVLRRLEMWARGYRETGQALEQCHAGMALLKTPAPLAMSTTAPSDRFGNAVWNVVFGRTGIGKSTWLWRRPQRPEILPGSLRFNLALGDASTEPQIPNILQAVDLVQVVARLPNGVETEMGPGHPALLSGGELQRLCLARTLLHWKTAELLLDEPTSAQSPEEEARLFQMLKNKTREKTVWIVSHRFEVARWADRLWECTGWDVIEEREHNSSTGNFPA